jgi:hypothetical protein
MEERKMKVFSKDQKSPQISRRSEYGDEFSLNVTDLLKKDKKKVFATLEAGRGKLEIRTEGVFLVFSSKNDKENFFSGLC